MIQLSLFLDNKRIIRFFGWIKFSNVNKDIKHPIYKYKTHKIKNTYYITKLLIAYLHLSYLRSKLQLAHLAMRQNHRIIGARVSIRRIITRCILCTCHWVELLKQVMGGLPHQRVNRGRTFLRTGTYYAGPFQDFS